MSTVYFNSPSDSAELRGAERAHFGGLVSSIGLAALGVSDMFGGDDIVAAVVPPVRDPRFLATMLRANESETSLRFPDGSLHNVWHLSLNACLAVGGEPLRFAARLHAQCEVHGWIAAEDRAWLAGVIEDGRASGLYRAGVGWEQIVEFLRARSDEPVVLSYSVCDGFPNPGVADAEDSDAWYELPREERWATAWAKLRGRDDLRIKPDGVLFGDGVNAFQARDEVTGWTRRWQKASSGS